MKEMKQYINLSDVARLLIFHTYRMNERGEKVNKSILEKRFGKEIVNEGLKEIFSQTKPLLLEKNKNYIVCEEIRRYYRLL
ncbi:MAG: hypothetical protein QXD43_00525 [Candidatus Aenigmatarchaeota archaeon]